VREDAHLLFGFATQQDRALFRSLIKVNGVGPKLALTILSGMDVNDFVRCVRDSDTAGLVRLPGVGKKTAERLLIEMRDRLRDWHVDGGAVADGSAQLPLRGNDYLLEAESALISLGYKPQEAARMIAGVKSDAVTTSEELIRAALKKSVKN
jgi:Holliday junction DNA helicase RuvA